MPTHRLRQTIDRQVADVFATVADLTTFPDWNPTTVAAEKLTDGEPGNGTRYLLTISGFGKQVTELSEFEENRSVRLEPKSRMFRGGHRFLFSAEADKTTVDHELEMNRRGIFILLSPLMGIMAKRNLRATAQALPDYLEGQGSES